MSDKVSGINDECYGNYINTILNNIKKPVEEMDFKSDRYYRDILEHTSHNQAIMYSNLIKNEFSSIFNALHNFFIELCNENDKYGKTYKDYIDGYGYVSSSNIRYIYHSLLIFKYIIKEKLNDIDIIEIGGGYGGLCFYINKLAKILNINIKSYTIFDLKAATQLQKIYLDKLNINVTTTTLGDNYTLSNNSFLISNYAFSEIGEYFQKEYIKNVIEPHATHGFMCWNSDKFYEFSKNKEYVIENERPMTGQYNKFIYFKPKVTSEST